MTGESKTKTVRNAMLGVVVVVMLGLVGCLGRKDSANMADKLDPSDVVEIAVAKEPLTIPEQLRKELEVLDVESILVINRKNEAIAFSVDGVPRDLCAPSKSSDYGSRRCKQEIPSQDLMMILGSTSASNPCGTCTAGGSPRSCKKSNDMRTCSTQVYDCDTNCVSN
ncbi:MAG: hypothetical protein ACREBU_15915 [Nitrososphaera sp.]